MSVTWFSKVAVAIDLYLIITHATWPTLKTAFANPRLFLHPGDLRTIFFQNVWAFMSDGVDENGRPTKLDLLPKAQGVVLELGAGHGHNCKYLDHSKVKKYVAVEPNELMHDTIIVNAAKAGFTSAQIQIIGCGAEDTQRILQELDGQQVDTLVSILSLCGIPNAKNTLNALVRDVLKPGGMFLFYEHVRCDPSPTLIWWQTFWTYLWEPVLGCRLDNPTHVWIDSLEYWDKKEVWGKLPSEDPNLFWHRTGRYTKKQTS